MSDWSAELYLRFADERTRPARDLLAAVPNVNAQRVVDAGCGPGNSTELLAGRWPDAAVHGFDTSPDMIEAARKRLPRARFSLADAATWVAAEPVDVLFANAVLQWLPNHETLLPRLLAQLADGGTLAIQMPDNLDEPSHVAMRDTAADGPWRARLAGAAGARTPLLAPGAFYDVLRPHASRVEVWRTTYHHPLASPAAIVQWLRSTGLKPFVDPLDEGERRDFLLAYEARVAAAYPARTDGTRLLAFPRLFLVATR